MLARALDAGVPAAWVTGDEVYGADPGCGPSWSAEGSATCWRWPATTGWSPVATPTAPTPCSGRVPARAWQCVSAGRGAKGHRYYDWAFIRLDDGDPSPGGQAGQRWLLVRRNRKTRELAFYHCWTPRPGLPGHPGPGRRAPLDHRGALPDRQGPGRPGPASGPPLALLVPLDHPGHARPRLPGGGGLDRTDPPPATVRADPVDLQRGPAPARDTARPSRR